ncbi:MAG: DMT family transporter [Candidatus Aminicenantales bacterium]
MTPKKSLLEIHTAVLLFGLAGLFGKWLPISPVMIVLGRVFFASITLALLLWFSREGLKIRPARNYFFLCLLGLLLSVHWISFFQSIQLSTVAVGLLSFSCYPVLTAFLEPLFFKEKLIKINILYALLCILGIFLIIPRFEMENTVYQGVLWGVFSGMTFAVLTILNRKFSQRFSFLLIAFFQDVFAALVLIPSFFIIRPHLTTRDIALLFLLGVFCTAGAHSLFIKGMRHIKAQTASIINSLEPVYGIILAFILLGEAPSLRTIAGGVVVLFAALATTLTSGSGLHKFYSFKKKIKGKTIFFS